MIGVSFPFLIMAETGESKKSRAAGPLGLKSVEG
jgi:hypothetical protein